MKVPHISLVLLIAVIVVMLSGCATPSPKLNVAIQQDNFVEASRLIEAGADVNSVDDVQSTPLILASMKGENKLVSLLIKKGANVNCQNKNGWTPINMAASNGHTETVILLIKNGASANTTAGNGDTPLIDAARKGHNTKTAKALIQNGANVNCVTSAGDTPLIIASVKGDIELATLLIQAGADVNSADGSGNTPLIIANKNADYWRMYGDSIGNSSNSNKNAYQKIAITNKNVYQKIAELLLQNGANPSLINEKVREIERKNKADSREFWKGAATLATGVAVGKATSGYTPDQQTRMMKSSMTAVDSGDTSELTQTTNQVKAEQAQSHKAKMQAIEAQKERDRAAKLQNNRASQASTPSANSSKNGGNTQMASNQIGGGLSGATDTAPRKSYRCVHEAKSYGVGESEADARADAIHFADSPEGGIDNRKTISKTIASCESSFGKFKFKCVAIQKFEQDSPSPCGARSGPSAGKSK